MNLITFIGGGFLFYGIMSTLVVSNIVITTKTKKITINVSGFIAILVWIGVCGRFIR